ncbi:Subtilase [Parasponia andersonii]|uniref:Subtilase n=1 Tax=Parasponia andersonii TaxID=3476 RepID=A0A2P5C8Z3_PARAD|nr:Subtilase [Parasponia andersonii]
MEIIKQQWRAVEFFYLILLSLFIFNCTVTSTAQERKLETYIVYVKRPDNSVFFSQKSLAVTSWYETFLPTDDTVGTLSSSDQQQQNPRLVHSYRNVASGFAAKLTAEEAKAMAAKDGVVSVQPSKLYPLHTTRSPNFLGLNQGVGLWKDSKLGQGVIIGVLDTGVAPDHPSFSDEGVPPPPDRWRGTCELTGAAACNNKLIGARNFVKPKQEASQESPQSTSAPLDLQGHGTHTASTAAGNFVKGASVFGNANGTAAGVAPLAHVAVYRICDDEGCLDADILAGIDAAVDDGVDVLSLSLGGPAGPLYVEAVAVGAFSAIQNGIFVSCSAGNDGPDHTTVSNDAPWLLTVGASSTDRKFKATVKLGIGEELEGEALFPRNASATMLPLVYAGAIGDNLAGYCAAGSLRDVSAAGKIVACDRGGGVLKAEKAEEVKRAGGAAMILMNERKDGLAVFADHYALPATHVNYPAAMKIRSYINSTSTPEATILFRGTVIGDSNAPSVALFSSRGPSSANPGILKPDILGPGVDILAAWPVSEENSTSKPRFYLNSGTSMACPHLSGVAALLKSSHPDWSPAAIKSAILTTADVVNLGGKPITDEKNTSADVFATGAGHVNPSKANNPGLIYDLSPEDYIPYLCGLNYTDAQVSIITDKPANCSGVQGIQAPELNYPTFSLVLGSEPQSYKRTVTNVGEANSIYTVTVSEPEGTKVSVEPSKLSFTEVNQNANYTITVSPVGRPKTSAEGLTQGYLKWDSDKHSVRSQISIIFD